MLLFVLPALILFSVFVIYPFIMGIQYSFLDWDGVNPVKTYVGFKNYTKLFSNKEFGKSLSYTIRYTLLTVITQNLGALIVANLINSVRIGRSFFKGIFFIPNVLSGVIVSFLWGFIFTKVLPSIAQVPGFGFLNISWFSDDVAAFWATVIVAFWLGVGYLTIIYLAGLNSIDNTVLEAAMIDGANAFHMLFRVKMPLIMQSVIIGIFMITMNGLKSFEISFLLTQGGPFKSTQSLALLSYNTAYQRHNYGLATAQAIILFAIVLVVTMIEVITLKSREVEN